MRNGGADLRVLFADKVKGSTPLFAGINKVRLPPAGEAGERIDFECTPVREVGPFCFAKVRGSVTAAYAWRVSSPLR